MVFPSAIARGKRNKFGAIRCEVDGLAFDSKAEARHYSGNLKLRQMAGEITGLRVHPIYPLVVNDRVVGSYEADFDYRDSKTGKIHVIDVKGGNATNTALSRMKQKLVFALYGLEVEIVRLS